jgi:hypothetical protein
VRDGRVLVVAQVAQHEPQRVADLDIALPGVGEELLVHLDIVLVGDRADPPAEDIGPVAVKEVLEGRALGLGQLLAVLVDHEAVREQGLEGGLACDA